MADSNAQHAENLKKVMRQLPFPVTVVTTAIGKDKRGITVGSFTSLSLEPPLISFNIDEEAQIFDLLTRATHYAIHIPEPEQSVFCDRFSVSGLSGEEQFDSFNHHRSSYGNPILNDISTVIQCRSYNKFKAGDHTIFIGQVIDIDQQTDAPGLLYHDRSYLSVHKHTTPDEIKNLNKSA